MMARARINNTPFNPASRFAGGVQGILFDPSNLSTLFQDAAGTVPVTAAGQTVKRINDLSGNGNFVSNSASTWTLQFDGTNYYLQTDGANWLTSAAFAWGSDKATIVAAVKSDIAQQSKPICGFGQPTGTGQTGTWDIELDTGGMGIVRRGSGSVGISYTQDLGTTTQVMSAVVDLSGTTYPTEVPFFHVDGASPTVTTGGSSDTGTGPFGTYAIRLGGITTYFTGRIYAFVAIGAISTSAQLAQLEQWASSKSGVGLAIQAAQSPVFLDTGTTSAGSGYTQTSAFSRAAYNTNAVNMAVTYQAPAYAVTSTMVQLGVTVNGAFYQALAPLSAVQQTQIVTLPAGSKRVEFIAGLQTSPTSTQIPPPGTFFVSATADAPMTSISEAPVNRLLLYGDSITVGADSTIPTEQGWGILIRGYAAAAASPYNVAWEAYGYRTLYRDYQSPGNLTAFIAQLVAYNPANIWLAIGTNDYGIITWSAANFGAAYAAVLDALHAALPSCHIYTQTPIVRVIETANSFGNTLGDYRTAIATAQSTRTGFTTFVDGTTILTTADLDAGGVHPTTAGHAKYATFVRGVLGI